MPLSKLDVPFTAQKSSSSHKVRFPDPEPKSSRSRHHTGTKRGFKISENKANAYSGKSVDRFIGWFLKEDSDKGGT